MMGVLWGDRSSRLTLRRSEGFLSRRTLACIRARWILLTWQG